MLAKMDDHAHIGDMSVFINYILPAFLIAIVLLAPKFRGWLETCVKDSERQTECVELYHSAARDFLSATDAKKDDDIRELVLFIGGQMMEDSKIVRSLIAFNRRMRRGEFATSNEASVEFENLSDDAKHAFARAMAAALLASSYQSIFFGRFYRRILALILDDGQKEVVTPSQVIKRVQWTRTSPAILPHAAVA